MSGVRAMRCPFCESDGAAAIPFEDERGMPWRVTCGNARGLCGARGPAGLDAEEANSRWNEIVRVYWAAIRVKIRAAQEKSLRTKASAAKAKK